METKKLAPLVLWALLFAPALADDPTIARFNPPGFGQGAEVTMEISGDRLADISQLLLYDPGVEVVELKAAGEKKVAAKLRIAADCPPGLHAVRVATRSGISNLRYFGISALTQTLEAEPNSDFAQPQSIALNTTTSGVITNEDVDYFSIELNKGQTVNVELEGLRLGTEFFDPFVAILDSKRFEVARSDDAPLVQQDCVCSYVASEDGTYIVQVRESSFGGNARCQYRLHVGDFPRPVAVVPAGGRPGELLHATIVESSGETWETDIQLPETAGDFAFVASRNGKSAPSPNMLRVVDMPNVISAEPDDDRAKLTAAEGPVAFNGILQADGDVDWFKIKGKKNQLIDIKVYGRKFLRSPIDSWLEIHKAKGGRVSANDDSGGPDSAFERLKLPEDGEYLIAIRDQLREGSPKHAYRIEVSPPQPLLRLTIDELTRYFSQTVSIPQGQQMTVLLRASRKNMGGDLKVLLENPPKGVSIEIASFAANQSYIPLLIKAAVDAPVDARLARLSAATTAADKPVLTGALDQRTMLVRGQNNRDMWGHNTQSLAIAVTEALPFSIEVVQPEVPIVRGGASHFVVKATRAEGFKERISLQAVYNPSGLSTSRSIRIEGDKTEVKIPVTANTKAGIGTFPIAILARAKARNATVWTSAPMVNLSVEDSYFNFKFVKSVVEQGAAGNLVIAVEAKRPPEGDVEFEILGLPAGVTTQTPKIKWDGEAAQFSFPIQVTGKARVAPHKTLYVRAVITRPGGQIQQTAGRGELQVIAPPPQQIAAATPKPAAKKTVAPPAAKPLSRLEQLRQAKQAAGGQ